jgi:hypothetical protein
VIVVEEIALLGHGYRVDRVLGKIVIQQYTAVIKLVRHVVPIGVCNDDFSSMRPLALLHPIRLETGSTVWR